MPSRSRRPDRARGVAAAVLLAALIAMVTACTHGAAPAPAQPATTGAGSATTDPGTGTTTTTAATAAASALDPAT